MPDQWFYVPEGSDFNDVNTGTLVYMQIARILDRCEFALAREQIQWALKYVDGMLGLHKNELKCELIFNRIKKTSPNMGEIESEEELLYLLFCQKTENNMDIS